MSHFSTKILKQLMGEIQTDELMKIENLYS